MASVPQIRTALLYRPYLYGLERPQTRRTNTLTGSLNNAAGGPPRGPQRPRNFAPQIRQDQRDFYHGALTTTGKCVMEMRTDPGNGLHPPATVLRTEYQRGACARLKRTAGPERNLHRPASAASPSTPCPTTQNGKGKRSPGWRKLHRNQGPTRTGPGGSRAGRR